MVLYPVPRPSDMIGGGLVLKGGLIKPIQKGIICGFCTQNDTFGRGLICQYGPLLEPGPVLQIIRYAKHKPYGRIRNRLHSCTLNYLKLTHFSLIH